MNAERMAENIALTLPVLIIAGIGYAWTGWPVFLWVLGAIASMLGLGFAVLQAWILGAMVWGALKALARWTRTE